MRQRTDRLQHPWVLRRLASGEQAINSMPVHVDNFEHPASASDAIGEPWQAAESLNDKATERSTASVRVLQYFVNAKVVSDSS